MTNQRVKITITGYYNADYREYGVDSIEEAVRVDQEVLDEDGPFDAVRWMIDDISIKVEAV